MNNRLTAKSHGESATQSLRDEHQVIMRVIESLKVILERGEAGGEYDFGAVGDCIRFFRLFADKFHHGKEEGVLFEELVEKGYPRDQGPIAVMLAEHEMGREYVRQMEGALPGATSGKPDSLNTLIDAACAYCHLLTNHIGKEDHCLFGMVDSTLDSASCGRICERYASACCGHFEDYGRDDLLALADAIEKKLKKS